MTDSPLAAQSSCDSLWASVGSYIAQYRGGVTPVALLT